MNRLWLKLRLSYMLGAMQVDLAEATALEARIKKNLVEIARLRIRLMTR